VSGALRSAGNAKTPMMLGIVMTVLNLLFNIILIRGLGPIPAFGTAGAAMGTCIAAGLVGIYSIYKLWSGTWVVSFPKTGYAPDWKVIKKLFQFGLPAGIQGIAMNAGGVLMYGFMGSLAEGKATQAVYAVAYSQLFLLVTWSSNALMGASAAVAGQNMGAGHPDRAVKAVRTAAGFGLAGAVIVGLFFFFLPRQLLAIFGMTDPAVVEKLLLSISTPIWRYRVPSTQLRARQASQSNADQSSTATTLVPIGLGHTHFDSPMSMVSTVRSVWSEPMPR